MANILITYSTTDGHTRSICERLQELVAKQHDVVLSAMADDPGIDLAPFDKVVIGASIRYGKHQQQVVEFISHNEAALESRPNAFFSVNLVARKPEKNTPETNPYLQKFLTKQISWKPQHLAVFAGKVDYPSYGFIDKQMIRLIMWMTKGPTDPTVTIEFTDWNKVDELGELISRM